MLKTRKITQTYLVCDMCGLEIKDNCSNLKTFDDGSEIYLHSMYKKDTDTSCLERFDILNKIINKNIKNSK